MSRPTRMVVLGLLLFALAPVVPAHAATGTYLRLAHLSPDTPNVDVTVTSFGGPDVKVELDGVGYGDVSNYQRIEPGSYTVSMRPAGADPSSPPVISATLDASDGKAYTVAGLGRTASLSLRVLDDDISLPASGQARMRVINAAPSAGDLQLQRAGAPVVEKATFGTATSYVVVPGGQTTLRVVPATAAPTDLPLKIEPGGVYSVLVLEKTGGLSAVVRVDAMGAQVAPAGGVDTGLGGSQGETPWPVLAFTGLLVLAVAGMLLRRRTG